MSVNRGFNTRKTTLGAMLVALGTALIYIGAVTEILDLSLCAAACLIAVFALLEFGSPFAFMVYTATALLSLIILPNKFAACAYIFMAFYSVIKFFVERLPKAFAWIAKLLYFNIGLVAGLLLAKYIFMLPEDTPITLISLFVLGNAAFVLFDIALSRLVLLYAFRLRRRLKIDRYLNRINKK